MILLYPNFIQSNNSVNLWTFQQSRKTIFWLLFFTFCVDFSISFCMCGTKIAITNYCQSQERSKENHPQLISNYIGLKKRLHYFGLRIILNVNFKPFVEKYSHSVTVLLLSNLICTTSLDMFNFESILSP